MPDRRSRRPRSLRPRRVVPVLAAALAAGPASAQQPTAPATRPPAAAAGAVLHGVVYDSLTRRPLRGALVQIVRADDPTAGRSVAADSAGAFRLDAVTPGRYLAGFLHPLLDLLEIELAPRVVEVAPVSTDVRVDLAVPDLGRVRPALCGGAAPAGDSSGVVAGRVRDADTDEPAAHATVVLTWTELTFGAGGLRNDHRRVPVTTGQGGTYVVCGVPEGDVVTASASGAGRASGLVGLVVPPRGLLLRDFALGDTATVAAGTAPADSAAPRVTRGTARLTGTVRDPGGRPVRGARAFVWGAGGSATTDESGTFALDALPAGTRTLEVRAIGFEPRRLAVDLAGGRAAAIDVRMAKPVVTLDRVTVMGKPSARTRMLDEFLDRKRRNPFGRFVTAADLERGSPIAVTDALRMMPGLRVVPTGGFGNAILGRGNCTPAVVLDGLPVTEGARDIDMLVTPQQVAGIEVYTNLGGAPPQYGGLQSNGCGVVLLWTKR